MRAPYLLVKNVLGPGPILMWLNGCQKTAHIWLPFPTNFLAMLHNKMPCSILMPPAPCMESVIPESSVSFWRRRLFRVVASLIYILLLLLLSLFINITWWGKYHKFILIYPNLTLQNFILPCAFIFFLIPNTWASNVNILPLFTLYFIIFKIFPKE